MNKTLKTNALALILLTTSIQTLQCHTVNNPPSFHQMIITFFYGNPEQPPVNTNHSPAGITEEHYIAQFCYDLNGKRDPNKIPVIPWDDVDKMAAILRSRLRLIDLNNPNQAIKAMRSVLKDYVETGSIDDIIQEKPTFFHQGYWVTQEDIQSISKSFKGNISARLKCMPHLNGESIAEFFGEPRKSAVRKAFFDRKRNGY